MSKFFIYAIQLLTIALSLHQQPAPIMLSVLAGSAILIGGLYRGSSCLARRAFSYYHSLVYSQARLDVISLLVPEDRPLEREKLDDIETLRIDNLRTYLNSTLQSLGFSSLEIRRVIFYMEQLAQNTLPDEPTLKAIQRTGNVSQCDLRHLAWNVGHVLGVSSHQQAKFAHIAFEQWFVNVNLETTRRTLLDSRGGKVRIPTFDKPTLNRMMNEPCDSFFTDKKEES